MGWAGSGQLERETGQRSAGPPDRCSSWSADRCCSRPRGPDVLLPPRSAPVGGRDTGPASASAVGTQQPVRQSGSPWRHSLAGPDCIDAIPIRAGSAVPVCGADWTLDTGQPPNDDRLQPRHRDIVYPSFLQSAVCVNVFTGGDFFVSLYCVLRSSFTGCQPSVKHDVRRE